MNENTNNHDCIIWQKARNYLANDTSPIHYTETDGSKITWYFGFTANPAQTEQCANEDSLQLYWLDGEVGGKMTTNVNEAFDPEDVGQTPVPVTVYVYDIKQAASFSFEEVARDWGTALMPKFELGGGDPEGNKKARIYKDDTAFRIEYDHAPEGGGEGETYFIELGDEGIKFNPAVDGGNHLILDHPPTPTDMEDMPENGVILVYDPTQPNNAHA